MSWKRERKKKNQHSFLKEKRYENRKKGGWQGSKKCVVIFSGSSPTFSCRRSEPFFGKGSLLQINDSPCSCLSGKSARRTRDGWWDTLWSCLSGDLSFPPDECANRCQPPQTLGQLFLLLCQDHQGKLALQREEGNGAYKVCWCEGVWRVWQQRMYAQLIPLHPSCQVALNPISTSDSMTWVHLYPSGAGSAPSQRQVIGAWLPPRRTKANQS